MGQMQIKKAQYLKGAVKKEDCPRDGLPQIALAGKSNVGKSSLINCVANNYKLARVSGQPGKTRILNFYMMNDKFYLVDLPGYGFARVSMEEQEAWGDMMNSYLTSNETIALIVHIVDIRHAPTQLDIQMAEWIRHFNMSVAVVATKADKISKGRWRGQIKDVQSALGYDEKVPIIPFSAVTRQGRDELLSVMNEFILAHRQN